ncbi:threonine synthase [Suicoccus acidiformans]|uniref:Threonine synthase n=1 Tax=Suicoccus acidiformans TaxID=2036206 RepID=A0A347WL55_9LACT|nr:threonine synthase [Suicoccus acidiformans]AXY25812.1 threonine synthase [Suicoccus acidiformans]
MNYFSSRNRTVTASPSQAILEGLASDGGLYVPEAIPQFENNWDTLAKFTYQEMAFYVLKPFLSDFSDEALHKCIQEAYDEKFDTASIAPLVKVGENYHLELFHGATIAFKDMALSILPHLMSESAKIQDNTNDIVILTATSGDTGKAAMAGFADVPHTQIIVFYPKGGVSSIQERQMLTQKGDNTAVVAIHGNFDDAQTEVKRLFNDESLRETLALEGKQFSSANSMNIGRLLPQVVYYYYAYAQLVAEGAIQAGDRINVTVPTGNFGNILAAYYAKQTGLPIDRLVCASNDNTVLYDFFQSGQYNRNRPFELTISPSMDILVSSNFERLLFHALDEDTDRVASLMQQLEDAGVYEVDAQEKVNFEDFVGAYASEDETRGEIKEVYEATDYVMDPHTAVASKAYRKARVQGEIDPNLASVIVSTASPYKFPEAVLNALDINTDALNDEGLLKELKKITNIPYPEAINEAMTGEIRHDKVIEVQDMKETVLDIIRG